MLGYVSGSFDILRIPTLNRLEEAIQISKESGNEYFAVGVYDERLCIERGLETPLKSLEDRINIIQSVDGVDFAFPLSSADDRVIKQTARAALESYLSRVRNGNGEQKEKEFDIVYAPGTYDLFHAGHLEHLMEAASRCNMLIAGVKSDDLVLRHKGKLPMLNAQERMDILRHIKVVDDVYKYYTRDPHIALQWIERKYGRKVDTIFLGSDLTGDFSEYTDLNFIYTERRPEMMGVRSTSALRLKLGSVGPSRTYTRTIPGKKIDKRHDDEIDIDTL